MKKRRQGGEAQRPNFGAGSSRSTARSDEEEFSSNKSKDKSFHFSFCNSREKKNISIAWLTRIESNRDVNSKWTRIAEDQWRSQLREFPRISLISPTAAINKARKIVFLSSSASRALCFRFFTSSVKNSFRLQHRKNFFFRIAKKIREFCSRAGNFVSN